MFLLINPALYAEKIHVFVKESIVLTSDAPLGTAVSLSHDDSELIFLQEDVRFIRGIEFELTAPQSWLSHQGSLAFGIYSNLDRIPDSNLNVELDCTQIVFEPLPDKIQMVYQIPLRAQHGLRGTPYLTLGRTPVPPEDFPILFRLTHITKGVNKELEAMRFNLNVKPIFSDEGALIINIHKPDFLPNGNYTVLIDEQVLENPGAESLVREGEHTVTLLSTDYRGENRRVVIERGKTLHLSITLHDLTPLIVFEAPAQARIFVDNAPITRTNTPLAVEPGVHDIRIQISDYTISKTVSIEKGKTYRVAFIVDMQVTEE
ncbi:MAG: PEGA domain-containing protein [Spirochaetaceae bacterium]|nr:PEGA domain-containing protein [Spirochaetaceae bacterium]